ncbi:MAG: hypothetical protein ACLQF0_03405 [Dissulfurispiraceae bacterium]
MIEPDNTLPNAIRVMFIDPASEHVISQNRPFNPYEFYQKHAKRYQVKPYSTRMPMKACFDNAFEIAMTQNAKYIEGFVVSNGIAHPHAWNEIYGIAMDATLEDPCTGEYYGVDIPLEAIQRLYDYFKGDFSGVPANGIFTTMLYLPDKELLEIKNLLDDNV